MTKADVPASAAETLSTVPYFAALLPDCEDTFRRLVQDTLRQAYEEGQVVFLEGEPCIGLYVVQQGWLKSVKLSPVGREQIVRIVGPGEIFNSIGVLIESSRNMATVLALEPAIVWIVRREVLIRSMEQCPRLARIITQHLAERVEHLMTLVEDLSLRSVEARLARLLLEQSAAEVLPRQRWATQ